MNLFDFLILVLAAFAFSIVIFLIFQIFFPPVVMVVNQPSPTRWWPWSVTSYNYWPIWMGVGGSSGGGDGGIRRSYQERCPSGSCHGLPTSHPPSNISRPWGGAERHANGGGFHHTPSTPSAPSPPSAPSAPSPPSAH